MSLQRIIVYKGSRSQTGQATAKRFPGLQIEDSKESFNEISEALRDQPVLAILPFWNSHGGEIKEAHVANLIFEFDIKLHEMWPSKIKFQCLARKNHKRKELKKIISVFAANPQCSLFITRINAEFKEADSTRDAFEIFCRDVSFFAVLVPPGVYEKKEFLQLCNDASNPVNFTSFVLLGKVDPKNWKGKKWNALCNSALPKTNIVYGIDMPIPYATLAEEQHELLEGLTDDIESLDDIPKITFVFEREGGRCGILIESRRACKLTVSPNEEGYLPDIVIKDNVGEASRFYAGEISNFINKKFRGILRHDFIKHIGTQACLYGCPPLNIFTHGFNPEAVEPVVRVIINQYFKLFDNGVDCSKSQKQFFKRHIGKYRKEGSAFINFV